MRVSAAGKELHYLILGFVGVLFSSFIGIGSSYALPWDVDMYSQQSLKSNEIARSPVNGTVPVGHVPFTMTIEEADKNLNNPVPQSTDSAWRGQRLWGTQCSACHGLKGDSQMRVGKLLGAPNLLEDRFKDYSDGKIFGTIFWGIRSMPRYGYKLSEAERWDIVNYLRFLQGSDVKGINRPSSNNNQSKK